jgi:hypothetical protein
VDIGHPPVWNKAMTRRHSLVTDLWLQRVTN